MLKQFKLNYMFNGFPCPIIFRSCTISGKHTESIQPHHLVPCPLQKTCCIHSTGHWRWRDPPSAHADVLLLVVLMTLSLWLCWHQSFSFTLQPFFASTPFCLLSYHGLFFISLTLFFFLLSLLLSLAFFFSSFCFFFSSLTFFLSSFSSCYFIFNSFSLIITKHSAFIKTHALVNNSLGLGTGSMCFDLVVLGVSRYLAIGLTSF